jgi:hypothetical protein
MAISQIRSNRTAAPELVAKRLPSHGLIHARISAAAATAITRTRATPLSSQKIVRIVRSFSRIGEWLLEEANLPLRRYKKIWRLQMQKPQLNGADLS